ncbi:MAG: hypothetical protein ACSLEX_03120 [Minisyncoccota bacterium]
MNSVYWKSFLAVMVSQVARSQPPIRFDFEEIPNINLRHNNIHITNPVPLIAYDIQGASWYALHILHKQSLSVETLYEQNILIRDISTYATLYDPYGTSRHDIYILSGWIFWQFSELDYVNALPIVEASVAQSPSEAIDQILKRIEKWIIHDHTATRIVGHALNCQRFQGMQHAIKPRIRLSDKKM